jgi:hypothetical protein
MKEKDFEELGIPFGPRKKILLHLQQNFRQSSGDKDSQSQQQASLQGSIEVLNSYH